jgi:hypothetical protein
MLMRIRKINNNDKRKILAYLLTLVVKKLKINVEQGRVVTILNNQTLNILLSVLSVKYFEDVVPCLFDMYFHDVCSLILTKLRTKGKPCELGSASASALFHLRCRYRSRKQTQWSLLTQSSYENGSRN